MADNKYSNKDLEKLSELIAEKVYQKLMSSTELNGFGGVPGKPPSIEYKCEGTEFTCGGSKGYACKGIDSHLCAGSFKCVAKQGFEFPY